MTVQVRSWPYRSGRPAARSSVPTNSGPALSGWSSRPEFVTSNVYFRMSPAVRQSSEWVCGIGVNSSFSTPSRAPPHVKSKTAMS